MSKFATRLAVVATPVLTAAGTAMAALPENVETEILTYKTDALDALGMVLAAGVAIWGLKKLGSKLGWF